jgi:hypothetical protein
MEKKMLRTVLKSCVSITLCAVCLFAKSAGAGPPFITDDPEPVDYKHWEVYIATLYNNDKYGLSGTAPHVEVNYGVVPNVQLHVIAPMAYNRPVFGSMQYGYGTTELGVKWRFVQENDHRPMVGIFPLVEAATGDSGRGLGTGQTSVYLPVWIQKSWGTWTTYGGGGYWYNPGAGNQDYGYIGWLLQKQVTKQLAIGTELFYTTATIVGGTTHTGFNIGGIYDFDEGHHLLFSAGDDARGSNRGMGYLAFQWTFGPHEAEKKDAAADEKKDATPAK